MYTDSDILFFPRSRAIAELLSRDSESPRFMLDCKPSLDSRVLTNLEYAMPPVNAGFWIIWQPLDWEVPMERFKSIDGRPYFHTEQTLMHLALTRAGAQPLDPNLFVLKIDDQFGFSSKYEKEAIALRHYVRGTRHMFWINAKHALGS